MAPSFKTSTDDASKTLIETLYGQIRGRILSGSFPPSSKLRIQALRDEYNVGSSTVREVLSRLTSDALVNAEERRGFRVADASLEDLQQISSARTLIDTQALRESIQAGDDAWEANVVAAFHRLSKIDTPELRAASEGSDTARAEWEARNKEFHDALVAACSNQWLLRFREILHAQLERYIGLSLNHQSATRDVAAEHKAIYEAALERDIDAACAATATHFRRTVEVLPPLAETWGAQKQ